MHIGVQKQALCFNVQSNNNREPMYGFNMNVMASINCIRINGMLLKEFYSSINLEPLVGANSNMKVGQQIFLKT
jgi:hypothetical protein